MGRTDICKLSVVDELYELVNEELLPGTGIKPDDFWEGLQEAVNLLSPENRSLLEERDRFQEQIDQWLLSDPSAVFDAQRHAEFLSSIGYLVEPPEEVTINPGDVDPEIALVSGPQLVVPVDNARYAINAANARWGSLYDAFYGTDAVPSKTGFDAGGAYNPRRGALVVERAMAFLDHHIPLEGVSHADVDSYHVIGKSRAILVARLAEQEFELVDPKAFVGFVESSDQLTRVLFVHNGLHIELQIDRLHHVGSAHPAGIRDVILESALTTIADCEDSVAAVDESDKCRVYRNWIGLMKGSLDATFQRGGVGHRRTLASDRFYTGVDRSQISLSGRSLLLVRNVGLHMYTDVVLDQSGNSIPEGYLDAFITAAATKHTSIKNGEFGNGRFGNVYIVKPKLHGPKEVAHTVALFKYVE